MKGGEKIGSRIQQIESLRYLTICTTAYPRLPSTVQPLAGCLNECLRLLTSGATSRQNRVRTKVATTTAAEARNFVPSIERAILRASW